MRYKIEIETDKYTTKVYYSDTWAGLTEVLIKHIMMSRGSIDKIIITMPGTDKE